MSRLVTARSAGFFLDQDHSSHWYVIPVEKREKWNDFMDLDEEDPKSWNVPEWANPIGTHPSCITFKEWESA